MFTANKFKAGGKMEEKEVKIKQVSEREIWVGENRFYLGEDNIICITMGPEYTDEKIALVCKEVSLRIFNMVEGKVNELIDLNKAGKQSSEARKIGREMFEHEKVGKVALFGMHPVARVIASFVMGVSKNKDMRFFKTKEEALAWLKE